MTRTQRRRDTPNPTRDGKHNPVCIDEKCECNRHVIYCNICEKEYIDCCFMHYRVKDSWRTT